MKIFNSATFWTHLLVLFLAVLILYIPSLSHGFVLDDHMGVEQNLKMRSLETIFANVGSPLSFLVSTTSVLRHLVLNFSYTIGNFDPAYYRIVNVIFHLAVVICGYVLLRLTTVSTVALLTALLFAVHPLLVESVIWISSVTHPQYSLFVLLSLLFYLRLKKSVKNRLFYITLFFASSIISFMSSEKALVLPFIIFLYEWALGTKKKQWNALVGVSILAGGIILTLAPFLQTRINDFSATSTTGAAEFINPLFQIPVVLGTYIGLIFWPERLTVYHLDEMGVQQSWLIVSALFTLFYFASLVLSYFKDKKIFFFLSIFFIANLPALIPIHIIQIAAERYAYLGTFGLIAAVVMILFKIVNKYKINVLWLYVILAICVVALAYRANLRAQDWESEMTIREATLRDAPYSSRALNNVGIQLMNEGRDEEALEYYKKAIALRPNYSHPYHNIGHMYALRGRYKEALPFYLKAMEFNRYEWKTRQDLGQVYFMLGKYPEAKEQIQAAIKQGSSEKLRLEAVLNRIKELGY